MISIWTILLALLCCSLIPSLSAINLSRNDYFYDDSEVNEAGNRLVFAAAGDGQRREDSTSELFQKRSAFGLFGLANPKRPHKTSADLVYPPRRNAFMSVRGRKRSNTWDGSPVVSRFYRF